MKLKIDGYLCYISSFRLIKYLSSGHLTSSGNVISNASFGLAFIVPVPSDGTSEAVTSGVTNYIPNPVK